MTLWYAFDKSSFSESMPDFIKRFFLIALFYTIMINPQWLLSVLQTVEVMGKTLTHAPIDPSSILSQGIGIANKILLPVEKSSILTMGFGIIIIGVVYLIIMAAFISIALDLALTLIITTALITVATLFLSFSALGATSQIARQALDAVLGNCVKLLGIYLVVAAGAKTITTVASSIPTSLLSFDPYMWIVAVVMLFWLLAKNLPMQIAKIVSGALQENQGTNAAALAISAVRTAQMATSATNKVGAATASLAAIAGSSIANAKAHFDKASATPGTRTLSNMGSAVGSAVKDMGGAIGGKLTDQFKNISSKLAGGQGAQNPSSGFAQRMNASAKDVSSSYSKLPKSTPPGAGSPSSAGRKAAGPSSTRSTPTGT
jgi:type IV secretory pathway TrbL component